LQSFAQSNDRNLLESRLRAYNSHVQRVFACAALVGALSFSLNEAAHSAPGAKPVGTLAGCPRATLPLPKRATAYASVLRRVTMQFVRTHPLHMKTAGAEVNGVLLVRHWLPSGWIKSECGMRVWERSLVVGVYYPAMDPPHNPIGRCNACARISFLLSRTPLGWLVWGLY
jgi:hypothetical protein